MKHWQDYVEEHPRNAGWGETMKTLAEYLEDYENMAGEPTTANEKRFRLFLTVLAARVDSLVESSASVHEDVARLQTQITALERRGRGEPSRLEIAMRIAAAMTSRGFYDDEVMERARVLSKRLLEAAAEQDPKSQDTNAIADEIIHKIGDWHQLKDLIVLLDREYVRVHGGSDLGPTLSATFENLRQKLAATEKRLAEVTAHRDDLLNSMTAAEQTRGGGLD